MNKIKQCRTKFKITQAQLAVAVGTNQSTINRYEAGKRNVTTYMADQIVSALNQLGCSCDYRDVFPDSTQSLVK